MIVRQAADHESMPVTARPAAAPADALVIARQGSFEAAQPCPRPTSIAFASVPLQIVYGDNIPSSPSDHVTDTRRAQMVFSRLFCDTVNRREGDAELLCLPDAGIAPCLFTAVDRLDLRI